MKKAHQVIIVFETETGIGSMWDLIATLGEKSYDVTDIAETSFDSAIITIKAKS